MTLRRDDIEAERIRKIGEDAMCFCVVLIAIFYFQGLGDDNGVDMPVRWSRASVVAGMMNLGGLGSTTLRFAVKLMVSKEVFIV